MWKQQYTRWQQKHLDNALFVFNVTTIILFVLFAVAACFWMPMVLGLGLVIAAQGVIRLIAAARGWDVFLSFHNGEEKESYTFRHILTIVTGWIFLLLGIGFDAAFLLVWLGVVTI